MHPLLPASALLGAASFAALWARARRALARERRALAETRAALAAEEERRRGTEVDRAFVREIFDHLPVSFFLVTPDHRIAVLNHATEKLAGIPRERILEEGCFGLFCDHKTHFEKCPGHASLFTGRDWDGSTDIGGRHYEVAVRPLHRGAEIPYSLVTLTDTTAIVRQREKLEKVIPRLETLLRQTARIRACIAEFASEQDPVAVLTNAMREAAALFRSTYAFLLRREKDGSLTRIHGEFRSPEYDIDYFTPEVRGRIASHFADRSELIYRAGQREDRDELIESLLRRAKSNLAYFAALRIDGGTWGYLGILSDADGPFSDEEIALRRDVVNLLEIGVRRARLLHVLRREKRELVAATEAAQLASRAKSTFLATMSHEIRTPLNAVIGFSELLAAPGVSTESVHEYTAGITRASNALLNLINDILDLSKLEAGAVDMHGTCDLARLFDDMAAIFSWRAREKDVALSSSLPGDFPARIDFPEPHMRHILLNLIGNAVKFTDAGSVSWSASLVREKDGSDTLDLRVADTGIGIDPARHESIFDPFVQDISSRGGKIYSGTGLGLPIVRRLLAARDGTIRVESTPGKGSTFLVRIPRVSQPGNDGAGRPGGPAAPAKDGDATPAPALPAGFRILLADDIPVNLRILSLHLKSFGIADCECVPSGNAALAALRERPASAVLTDLWMPDGNGADLARAMRADPALAHIPVIAVTADNDLSATFDPSLFDGILTKPVSHGALRTLLASLCSPVSTPPRP